MNVRKKKKNNQSDFSGLKRKIRTQDRILFADNNVFQGLQHLETLFLEQILPRVPRL